MAHDRGRRLSRNEGVAAPFPSRRVSDEEDGEELDNAVVGGNQIPERAPSSVRTLSLSTYARDIERDAGARSHIQFNEKDTSALSSNIATSDGAGASTEEKENASTSDSADAKGESPGAGGGGPPEGPPDAFKERSKKRILTIMFALGMAVFLAALDITIITTALPTIAEYFHSSAAFTWIGSAYLLAVASSTPIWGKISDVFGRKPVLLVANVLFLIGSLIAGLSINIGMLISARAIQGIGGGGLVTLVNITIGDLFSPRRRGSYYGIIGGVWAIASSVGPIIGGVFTEKVTWRWCFYINLPLDGLAFFIILIFLDLKTPRTPFLQGMKSVDWLGAFLIISGTLLLLFGLEYGGVTFPWDSATVLSLLIIGGALIIGFGFVERYVAKNPIFPHRIFYRSTNVASLGVCFVQSFVFISGSYYLPLYFQGVKGATPLLSGVYLLATTLALSVGSIFCGIFIRKTGNFLIPIMFGLVLMTIGYGLFINFSADSNFGKIIPYQVIAGLGVGPLFQAPLIALQSAISPRDIGTATAAFGFTRNIGTAVSVVVGSVVFDNTISKHASTLFASLPPDVAGALSGGDVGSNVGIINALPPGQKQIARQVFADSLRPAWIMYTCISAFGLLVACFIGTQKLSTQHKETETGLEAEKAARAERLEEDRQRKAARAERRLSQHQHKQQGGATAADAIPKPLTVGNGSIAARSLSTIRGFSRERFARSRSRTRSGVSGAAPAAGGERPDTSMSGASDASAHKEGSNKSKEDLSSAAAAAKTTTTAPARRSSGTQTDLEPPSFHQQHATTTTTTTTTPMPPPTSMSMSTSGAGGGGDLPNPISSDRLYSDLSGSRTYSALGGRPMHEDDISGVSGGATKGDR